MCRDMYSGSKEKGRECTLQRRAFNSTSNFTFTPRAADCLEEYMRNHFPKMRYHQASPKCLDYTFSSRIVETVRWPLWYADSEHFFRFFNSIILIVGRHILHITLRKSLDLRVHRSLLILWRSRFGRSRLCVWGCMKPMRLL